MTNEKEKGRVLESFLSCHPKAVGESELNLRSAAVADAQKILSDLNEDSLLQNVSVPIRFDPEPPHVNRSVDRKMLSDPVKNRSYHKPRAGTHRWGTEWYNHGRRHDLMPWEK